jgi:hypothetical protein
VTIIYGAFLVKLCMHYKIQEWMAPEVADDDGLKGKMITIILIFLSELANQFFYISAR